MPDVIKAALSTDLVLRDSSSVLIEAPQELQYMPPGTHRINPSRSGKAIEAHLDDMEDIYLAQSRLEAVRAGKEKTYSLTEVESGIGLED